MGNVFRITVLCEGNPLDTGNSPEKGPLMRKVELIYLLLWWTGRWTNSRIACDLRRLIFGLHSHILDKPIYCLAGLWSFEKPCRRHSLNCIHAMYTFPNDFIGKWLIHQVLVTWDVTLNGSLIISSANGLSLIRHLPEPKTSPIINKTLTSKFSASWWRNQMEIFSVLLSICAWNSPVSGEFPAPRPVTRSFDVFFDLRLNERLSKHSWGWWLETPSYPLWRHSYVFQQNTNVLFHEMLLKFTSAKWGPLRSGFNVSNLSKNKFMYWRLCVRQLAN